MIKNLTVRQLAVSALGTACLFSSIQALAHHPIKAKFNDSHENVLKGVVTAIDWRNPHAHIFMNVTGNNGIENWAVELESPVLLRRSGWDPATVQPGDTIVVTGSQARDGSRQIWSDHLILSGTEREVFTLHDTAPVPPLASRPAPRWPDGQVALGNVSGGGDGYWSYPDEKVLIEDGVDNIAFDSDGRLINPDQASKVAPFQPWALGLYKYRQQRMLQDDPMYLNCKPPGGPRQFQSDLGFQLMEDRDNDRVFTLLGSGNHNYKIIYLDGRTSTGLVTGDDDNPLYYGRSLARWEGDTLVLDTKGFNEDFWFSNGGLPHTDQLTMEERFTRQDADTLHYAVRITDPGAYTRPWSASWNLHWVGGEDLAPYFCQNNRQ